MLCYMEEMGLKKSFEHLTKKCFYKDKEPEETIFLIRQILHNAGIFVVERFWFDGFDSFYSCRLEIEDTSIGVNGKGSTIVFALASAYGELLERLQTHMLFMNMNLNSVKEELGFQFDPREKHVEKDKLRPLPISFKKSFMFADEYTTYDYWVDVFLQEDSPKEVTYLPFYDIQKEEGIFLPSNIVYMLSGSNGMCAGNTKYEALSQGISEIFERYVMKKVYFSSEGLPSVPEHHLKKYFWKEYELIQKIQLNSNFAFDVKDCTFGGMYPVMAIVVRDLEHNRYAVCFGADPDIRIALQRCITEVFQGSLTLLEKSHPFELVFPSDISNVDYNEQLKSSSGKWAYPIFRNKEEAFPIPSTFYSSKEKYDKLIAMLYKNGADNIYIRDCSFTEFHTYQIIIPGFSEAFIHDKARKTIHQRLILPDVLSKDIVEEEVKRICSELLISNKLEYGNKLYWLSHCTLNVDGVEYSLTWQYLMFALLLRINQLEQAGIWLREHNTHTERPCKVLLQVYNYICLRMQGIENDQAFNSLEKIYGIDAVKIIKQIIDNPVALIEVNYESLRNTENAIMDVYLKVKRMQLKYYEGEKSDVLCL